MLDYVETVNLPTAFGEFKLHGFFDNIEKKELVVLTKGDVSCDNSLTRIHSECLTGDAFTSLRCDCRAQLEFAMSSIETNKSGMIIYLRQEGRGIGLLNKIRAYKLIEEGFDTVDANLKLGFKDDARDYKICLEIFKHFNVKKVNLLTNNPKKIKALQDLGVDTNRVAIETKLNKHNKSYIETKVDKLGHLFSKKDES